MPDGCGGPPLRVATDGRYWPVAGECEYESRQLWSMAPFLTAGADSISAHGRDARRVKPSWWPCEEPGRGAGKTSPGCANRARCRGIWREPPVSPMNPQVPGPTALFRRQRCTSAGDCTPACSVAPTRPRCSRCRSPPRAVPSARQRRSVLHLVRVEDGQSASQRTVTSGMSREQAVKHLLIVHNDFNHGRNGCKIMRTLAAGPTAPAGTRWSCLRWSGACPSSG